MSKITAVPYEYTNDRLNQLIGWDIVWIVQGPRGRLPIVADTQQEAIEKYVTGAEADYDA